MKKPLIVIVGPTAVGKTKLSIEIAKQFNGEVISGDSMQVYRGMDIGTAKVRSEEMEGIPHHLIDIQEPCEPYTAAEFQRQVNSSIASIQAAGRLPIIAGGSGLYIQSVLYGYRFGEQKRDEERTAKLEKELEELGADVLHTRLKTYNAEKAEKIHPNNHRRLIRALELYETKTTSSKSELMKNLEESSCKPLVIGLEMERSLLYHRINERVDQMIAAGLIDEVKTLVAKGYQDCQAMNAIGYKELIPFIKGDMKLDEAIELLKRNSRRYAKRQYTWFRNKMDVQWHEIRPEHAEKSFSVISSEIAGFLSDF